MPHDDFLLHPTVNPNSIPTDVPITRNTGVFLGMRPTDYIAGKIGNIQYVVVNPLGDWRNYLVRGEKQWFTNFDTFNCTGFSNNNLAEISLKYQTGKEYNFSDRAMSVLAECTTTGNYLYKPADVGKNVGRILEDEYPNDPAYSWNDYNKPLTNAVRAKLMRFVEQYEWVSTDRGSLQFQLKHAPILIVIGSGSQLHVVVAVYVDSTGIYYFDSYDPWLKKTTQTPLSALKIIIKPMMTTTVKYADGNTLGVLIDTPNGSQIIKATGEEQWRSWNKPSSYGLPTVNPDNSTNWNANLQLPF